MAKNYFVIPEQEVYFSDWWDEIFNWLQDEPELLDELKVANSATTGDIIDLIGKLKAENPTMFETVYKARLMEAIND